MHNDLIIRPTTREDTVPIASIAETTELFPGEMLGDMIAGYFNGTKTDLWLTAALADEPVAFAFCEPERLTNGTWNLLAIGVRPDHQGQGIGARLVARVEEVLRDGGHRILLVDTSGTPEFERTRAFYRSNGFDEQARIREFYDVGTDKVVFWKHL
jgi:GNAT superfamily N-acetyltransferase